MKIPHWLVAGAVVAALLALLLGFKSAQSQQSNCGPTDQLTAAINKIGEKLAADALMRTPTGNFAIRIFAHPKTRTWTMMMLEGERACLIALGEGWTPARLPGSDI